MDITKRTQLTREKGWTTGVSFDAIEASGILEWIESHVCDFTMNHKWNASYVIRQSSSSGIGTNTVIRCQCGEGKDVTNYSSW